jgi:alpha-glucosidase
MVWDAAAPSAGFSSGRPWLPVKAPQAANAVAGQIGKPDSVLEFYRSMLKLRRETPELRSGRTRFFDVSEPLLAFTRGGTVLCLFNLSPEKHRLRLRGAGAFALAQGAEHHQDDTMTLHPNGYAIMEAEADVSVGDVPACEPSPAV